MKHRLKEITFEEIYFSKVDLQSGTLFNLKYKNESLEFQSPKLIIDSLVKQNDNEFIILKILPTQGCKTFCDKINQLEAFFSKKMENSIKSVIQEDLITVKIPFKYSRPLVKVYKDDNLFNYYHLEKDLEIICLLCIDKIWVNNYQEASYHLNVKEIMLI